MTDVAEAVPEIGQWVKVSFGRGVGSYIARIDRVTPKQFTLTDRKTRFRHNCEVIGADTWDMISAKFITKEDAILYRQAAEKRQRRAALQEKMKTLDYGALPDEMLIKLEGLFPEYSKQPQ